MRTLGPPSDSQLGVAVLEGFPNGEASWSDDSSAFFATNENGVSRYSADPQEWVEIACGIVRRELTVDEWHQYIDPDSDPIPACP
ncbi:MAG TPA: hypothetical protein VJ978_12710 [Nitriliruptoraceae bacterium]|nr:hypothetical protein [Nitriliruptoraceae bacterium]